MKLLLKLSILMVIFIIFPEFSYSQFALSPTIKCSFSHSYYNSSGANKTFEWKVFLGLNSYIKFCNYFYYSPDISLIISQGGIGNDAYRKCKTPNKISLDIMASLVSTTFTLPSKNIHNYFSLHRLLPSSGDNYLYPQKYLVQLSSVLIFHREKNYNYRQRLGQIQIRLNNIQIGYYNDATPFNKICYGDGYDRYNTGGVYLKLNLDNSKFFNFQIGYEFEKFTGYQTNAFELNNLLAFEFILMSQEKEIRRNSNISRLFFSASKSNQFNINAFMQFRDYNIDIQDFIHKYISLNPIFRTHDYPSKQLGISFTKFKLNI